MKSSISEIIRECLGGKHECTVIEILCLGNQKKKMANQVGFDANEKCLFRNKYPPEITGDESKILEGFQTFSYIQLSIDVQRYKIDYFF